MPLYVKTGQFTGTGSGFVPIDFGFVPKAFMIWGPLSGSVPTFAPRLKTDSMSANDSAEIANVGFFTDGKLTFAGNRVVCSSEYNSAAKVYHYLAIGGTDCITGSYTGNGTDNRNVTGIGINPDLVILRGEQDTGINGAVFKVTSHDKSTDISSVFRAGTDVPNYIQQLLAGGFQIGTNDAVNKSATIYHYIAIAKDGNTAFFAEGTYTGNNTDNRNITGLGFEPTFAAVKTVEGGQITRLRSVETTDISGWVSQSNSVADGIQAWITDGFQIGLSSSVNTNLTKSVWFAFKDNAPPTNSDAIMIMMQGAAGLY